MPVTPEEPKMPAALDSQHLLAPLEFEQLMRRHNRMLFRTARAILRNDAEAEDALQEAYVRAYRAYESFRGDAKVSTWLVRIVANEALARRRKEVRRAQIVPIRSDPEQHELEAQPAAPSGDGPDSQAERSQIRRLLEAKIDALPDAFRSVFVLRALEELSVEDTAAALGIPEATVRTRFFRARSQLREALSQEIDLAFDDAFAFAGERCDRIVARVMARLAAGEGDRR
jgi:RNA polymerase sigma-70 factor (ECF subfamily)